MAKGAGLRRPCGPRGASATPSPRWSRRRRSRRFPGPSTFTPPSSAPTMRANPSFSPGRVPSACGSPRLHPGCPANETITAAPSAARVGIRLRLRLRRLRLCLRARRRRLGRDVAKPHRRARAPLRAVRQATRLKLKPPAIAIPLQLEPTCERVRDSAADVARPSQVLRRTSEMPPTSEIPTCVHTATSRRIAPRAL